MYYGYQGFNPYSFTILVLIVLQWTMPGSDDPDNLTNNGGLFIITLFALVMCCKAAQPNYPLPYLRRRRGFL